MATYIFVVWKLSLFEHHKNKLDPFPTSWPEK